MAAAGWLRAATEVEEHGGVGKALLFPGLKTNLEASVSRFVYTIAIPRERLAIGTVIDTFVFRTIGGLS